MSQSVSFNGVVYTIPDTGDDNWGDNLTDFFVAIPSGALQKSGGTFTLTADVNFGANFGLVSTYFKSRSSNIASAGVVRLANTDLIAWRNNANAANLALGVSTGDRLQFGAVDVPTISSADTLTNKTLTAPTINGNASFGVSSTTAAKALFRNSTNDRRFEVSNDGTSTVLNSTYGSFGSSGPILFQITDATKMTLDTSGRLGLGTTPSDLLHISEGNIRLSSASIAKSLGFYQSGTQDWAIQHNTDRTLSIDSPGARLLTINATGGDSSFGGKVLLGKTSTTDYGAASAALLQVAGSNSGSALERFVASASGPSYVFAKSRGASAGSATIVQSGDTLGGIYFNGADGTDLQTPAAQITAEVDGTPGANDMPGRLVFSTTADGASTTTERIRIQTTGDVRFNALSGGTVPKNSSGEMGFYQTGNKYVIWYNDAGTVRYKYLDMSGTGVTWVHTTTAP